MQDLFNKALQIDTSKSPPHTLVHTTIAEDDMSVNDCFSVFHQDLFKNLPSYTILTSRNSK